MRHVRVLPSLAALRQSLEPFTPPTPNRNRESFATPQSSNRSTGGRFSCGRGYLFADNRLANGGKRNAGELQMLKPEGNPYDGDKTNDGRNHMPNRQPD